MNIIMSLWSKPCTDGKAHGFSTIDAMIQSLIVSSNVAKKHYENIHFYTDKLGYEWIEPYLDRLPFTKIEVCLDQFNYVPDIYWSFVKVCVYTLQKEPFIHIDNDVFLWDKIPDYLLENKDFVFQETEPLDWTGYFFYKDGLELYSHAVREGIKVEENAVNCGVFACLTQDALNLLQEYYDDGKYFIDNADLKPNIAEEPLSRRVLASVIIEQVFIFSQIVKNNLRWGTLLNDERSSYRMRYTHTVAHWKRHPIIEAKIRDRVLEKNYN
jgi:hypothetical protein